MQRKRRIETQDTDMTDKTENAEKTAEVDQPPRKRPTRHATINNNQC
jgi:hypothetical protein